MEIPQLLLAMMFYFLCMFIDITLFFLVVRALVVQWPTWWLVGLNIAGGRLVDELLVRIRDLWSRWFPNRLSGRGQLIAAIILFYIVWLVVRSIATVVW